MTKVEIKEDKGIEYIWHIEKCLLAVQFYKTWIRLLERYIHILVKRNSRISQNFDFIQEKCKIKECISKKVIPFCRVSYVSSDFF